MNRNTVASRLGAGQSPLILAMTSCLIVFGWLNGSSFGGVQSSLADDAPKWADPALPVRDSLVAWFDARTLPEAMSEGSASSPLRPGDLIQRWPDGSGSELDLIQEVETARPTWIEIGEHRAVRFRGEQWLALRNTAWRWDQATVIVVGTPFANGGFFRSCLSAGAVDINDYQSGINLDLGPLGGTRFDTLNVEGVGFGGARDLFEGDRPFGRLSRIAVDVGPIAEGMQEGQVTVRVDGRPVGNRTREPGNLVAEVLSVGARWYDHGGPPKFQGFWEGDIAAILIYDRQLSEQEHTQLDQYLAERYGEAVEIPLPEPLDGGYRLVTETSPPRIQVLEPGFRIRRSPLNLTNINNLVYRHDGRLMALGYDGRLWWLDDADGDGLEDQATLYFDGRSSLQGPIGLALAPLNYPHGFGAFVPSKGKVSFIVDTDGDDVADQERVIAEGWQALPHGVDALGIDVHPLDGSIWFGLGVQDFTNAYLVGPDGQSRFELSSERGTVQRIAPDLKSRKVVATGIRFPVGLRFSSDGEAFVSDQEGATWLPNGNPFDELLHVQEGRHYGFPPRHPRHLPGVIDEPSVFDYGPQHQSTCGLNFNRPVQAEGPIFGPERWRDDLFVAGYSRGKLYRTSLQRTKAGFIADNRLFACADMLVVDCVVSPRGTLLVALHGGGPDWGNGPNGMGEIWEILPEEPVVPRPTAAWASSPRTLVLAFDAPLDDLELSGIAERLTVEQGSAVASGDRFETLRPGYQVVADQMRATRRRRVVHGVQVTADRRSLLVSLDESQAAQPIAVTLHGLGRAERVDAAKDSQFPESSVGLDASGIEAELVDATGRELWRGVLPHLDLEVSQRFRRGVAEFERLEEVWLESTELRLKTRLDLSYLLRPQVQPGAVLDHAWPAEMATLRMRLPESSRLTIDRRQVEQLAGSEGQVAGQVEWLAEIDLSESTSVMVELTVPTLGREPAMEIEWWTADDSRPRPFPLRRFRAPWESQADESERFDPSEVHPMLAGGNWERGKRLFFGETGGCAKCHRFDAVGGAIGPDLSNLPMRDVDSILRDLERPSFAIHPDHLSRTIMTEDGTTIVGTVRTRGDLWVIGTSDGKEVEIDPETVTANEPTPTSIMPEGLLEKLIAESPSARADLLTFLTTSGPRMPDYGPLPPPPGRARDEIDRLRAATPSSEGRRPIRVLLVDGPKDHGPGEHDYPAWRVMWKKWLALAEGVSVDEAHEWPSAEQWQAADTVIVFQRGSWDERRAEDVDRHFARGGGLILLHWAVEGGDDPEGFARRIGLAGKPGGIRYRHGPLSLDFGPGASHPLAAGFEKIDWYDESYWNLVGDPARLKVLATGVEEGEARPLFWTLEPDGGRVFVSILGHYMWTFDDPAFRVLMARAIAWSAGEDVDRLEAIIDPGANWIREGAEALEAN